MLKFHTKIWGCQMNYADVERLEHILIDNDYEKTEDPYSADLIILVTCSVRQKAEDKFLGIYRQIKELKDENANLKIVMTGCMSQRIDRATGKIDTRYLESLKKKLSWVDYFIPIGEFQEFSKVLNLKALPEVDNYMDFPSSYHSKSEAYVPISTGCNNFCTYCIVPYTRGKEISRSFDSIVSECESLVSKNFKLIRLLGQNVNSWSGSCGDDSCTFSTLLKKVSEIEGDFWLNFITSHPKDLELDLIKVLVDQEKVAKYLNLPIQSGSDKILERMNRKYTRSSYLNKINLIKQMDPEVRLSTDIIVGFPGETEEDFICTKEILESGIYEMAYISEYSPRQGTVSYNMEDDVPREVKSERKRILSDLVMKQAFVSNAKFVGKTITALILDSGKAKNYQLIDVIIDEDASDYIGKFVKVKISSSGPGGLHGSIAV